MSKTHCSYMIEQEVVAKLEKHYKDDGSRSKSEFVERAINFSLDDKRSPVSDNDIPDIVARFHNLASEEGRERTEQSFFVPKKEIVDNGYDLSINNLQPQGRAYFPPSGHRISDR